MSLPIQFTHRNAPASEALIRMTEEKFERLYKYAPNITMIHVTFNTDHLLHIAEAEIHIPKIQPVYAEAKTEDMYKSLDLLLEKLTKQLAKHKDKHSH